MTMGQTMAFHIKDKAEAVAEAVKAEGLRKDLEWSLKVTTKNEERLSWMAELERMERAIMEIKNGYHEAVADARNGYHEAVADAVKANDAKWLMRISMMCVNGTEPGATV
jgi:hypothetical protein